MAPSTPAVLDTATGTAATSAFVTNSVAPTANALVMVAISAVNITSGTSPTIDSISTSIAITGSWAEVDELTFEGGSVDTLTAVWYAQVTGTPGSGTLTINTSGDLERWCVTIFEVTGHDTTTPITNDVSDTNALSTLSLTLPGSPAADSIVVGVITSRGDTDGVTEGGAFAELVDATSGSSNQARQQIEYDATPSSTTVDWSALNTVHNVAIAFEILAAAGGGGNTYEMAATLTATSATNNASIGVLRELAATLTGVSATNLPYLRVVRPASSALTAQSSTTLAALSVVRAINVTLTALSATNTPALVVLRELAATLTAVSRTTDIDLLVAGLIEAVATLTAQSATSNASLQVLRTLVATLTAISSTTDIDLVVAGLLEMAATLSAASRTTDINLTVTRAVAATLTAQSATGNAELLKYLNSAATLLAQSHTNDAALQVVRQGSVALTATTATTDAALQVVRALSATLTAQSSTSEIALVTSVIVGLVTATFTANKPGAGFTVLRPNGTFAALTPGATFDT